MAAQIALDTLHLEYTVHAGATLASSDNMGNIYLQRADQAIEKYGPEGQLLGRYSQNRYGAAAAIDAANPLKLMVWYPDFGTAVWLDRSMTLLGELNLINAGFPNVRTVGQALDGNLWIYDEAAFVLQKIDPTGIKLFESQLLNQLLPDRLLISAIRDDGTGVYASDPGAGLLIFDAFAQFQRLYPVKGVHQFHLAPEGVVFVAGDSLLAISLLPLAPPVWTVKLPGVLETYWLGYDRLIVQRGQHLDVFSWRR